MSGNVTDAERAAVNESMLRDHNERIKAHNASHSWVDPPFPDWVCECARDDCREPVRLSIAEYEAVRLNPVHFIVVPSADHVQPEIERVVKSTERYWVIEKLGEAAEVSEVLDPRSDGSAVDEPRS
jgi:hypothetical protein